MDRVLLFFNFLCSCSIVRVAASKMLVPFRFRGGFFGGGRGAVSKALLVRRAGSVHKLRLCYRLLFIDCIGSSQSKHRSARATKRPLVLRKSPTNHFCLPWYGECSQPMVSSVLLFLFQYVLELSYLVLFMSPCIFLCVAVFFGLFSIS